MVVNIAEREPVCKYMLIKHMVTCDKFQYWEFLTGQSLIK